MKLAILTSNEIRHKYLANTLSECVDDALVICEHHESNPPNEEKNQVLSPIDEHFNLRTLTERKFFSGNDSFKTGNILDLMYKEASLEHSYETVKSDLDLLVKKLKKNSIILCDDYNIKDYGVKKAVDEIKFQHYFEDLGRFSLLRIDK